MAKEWAKSFYNGKAWKACRESYIAERIKIDGGMCEVCHENLGYIVHHTILLTPDNINDPDVALNHELLRYECKQCHDEEDKHFVKRIDDGLRDCIFDDDGNLIALSPPTGSDTDEL